MKEANRNNDTYKSLIIGIVLSATPKYSETFFINKIDGLLEKGHKVILFVDTIGDYQHDKVKVVEMASINGSKLIKLLASFFLLLKAFIIHPVKSMRHYSLDKKDGISFAKRLKNIILNQVFFKYTLDWLHFGFGMFVMNRENVAKTINAKMALSFRGSDLYLSPLRHENCYDNLFYKNVRYHVLSEQMKQTLIESNIAKSNIFVINPAINIELFKGKPREFLNQKLKIVTTARLHWKKGLIYTLEALAYLKIQDIDFEYTIIGEGDQRERILFAAYQLGILDNITLVGKLPQNKIIDYLKEADIYIQYSIQEGFCNAVLEAQAVGSLCIVSNADGLDENVENGVSGWVVKKRQPKLLADKIIEVHNLDNDQKKLISQNAIKRVEKEFHLEKQKSEFSLFYTS